MFTIVRSAAPCRQLPGGDRPSVRNAREGSARLQLPSSRHHVHGGSRAVRVALQPGPMRQARPFEWRHPVIGRGRGALVAVVSGVAGAAPPLQLRHRFVAHLVSRLVEGPVPAEDNRSGEKIRFSEGGLKVARQTEVREEGGGNLGEGRGRDEGDEVIVDMDY